jgi:hypothetical protein
MRLCVCVWDIPSFDRNAKTRKEELASSWRVVWLCRALESWRQWHSITQRFSRCNCHFTSIFPVSWMNNSSIFPKRATHVDNVSNWTSRWRKFQWYFNRFVPQDLKMMIRLYSFPFLSGRSMNVCVSFVPGISLIRWGSESFTRQINNYMAVRYRFGHLSQCSLVYCGC